MRMPHAALALVLILGATEISVGQTEKPPLLREPSISRTQIAFAYAGDLWTVGRDSGEARRLTTSIGIEANPVFSPDGTQIAFTGEYDGNQDVYVMPASGGVPRRLTYHPGPDATVGWTPDGKEVLFSSTRSSFADGIVRLFTIPADYLPDTYAGGYTNFNRYYFAQVGKEAAIIDERFNGGGDLADYIIDCLRRPQLNFFTMREGLDITTPQEAIFGPKVMIINEMASSGGDAMPWMFRKSGIGPLVGKRTWGGLVGHCTNPADLLDGGFTGVPNLAFYTLDGKWDVENHGVPPDYDVEMDPKAVREGHDPQLEKAVEVVMELLKKNPAPTYSRPPYPNYHK